MSRNRGRNSIVWERAGRPFFNEFKANKDGSVAGKAGRGVTVVVVGLIGRLGLAYIH